MKALSTWRLPSEVLVIIGGLVGTGAACLARLLHLGATVEALALVGGIWGTAWLGRPWRRG